MEIIQEHVHEDGSATYSIAVTEEERDLLVPSGVQLGILCGITGLTYTQIVRICLEHLELNPSDLEVDQQ